MWLVPLLALLLSACDREPQQTTDKTSDRTGAETDAAAAPEAEPDAAFIVGGDCGEPAVGIPEIQGAGESSPLLDEKVTVEASVAANFQAGLDGIFLIADQRPSTAISGGLFVYLGEDRHELRGGDRIRVTGTVSEHGDPPQTLTQLSGITDLQKCAEGATLMATRIPSTHDQATLEAHEGMLVELEGEWRVSGHGELERFGSLMMSHGERLYMPTQVLGPGNEAGDLVERMDEFIIHLDDGSARTFPRVHAFPLSAVQTVRLGDQVVRPTGILDQRFGAWRLHPVGPISLMPNNPRPSAPPSIDGDLRLAAFNLGNYFNGSGGRFAQGRGPRNSVELERQVQKLSATIALLKADVIALAELENDGYGRESAIATLTDAVNGRLGDATAYDFVDAGVGKLGWDRITVGLLYRIDTVEPVGSPATLGGDTFATRNRPPLAQTFQVRDSDIRITVIAVHLKSKGGCDDADSANQDQGDGQGCWNPVRTEAARQLAAWVGEGPTDAGQGLVAVLGDFNAYPGEAPIVAMSEGGLAPVSFGYKPYTSNWRAFSGQIDHAFVSRKLAPMLRSSAIWHINADEPSLLDWSLTGRSAAQAELYFSGGPARSSDHDPILVGLEFPRDESTAEP